MRIVGQRDATRVLGVALAAAGIACGSVSAGAQTTVIGGDWRPQVEVDSSVLDRLGPEPTLPDLLLGRRPMAPPGAPVKLHRPHVAVAHIAKPAKTTKLAAAELPADQSAKTESPAPVEKKKKAAGATETAPAKPTKKLASSFEPPPPPKAVANADMPGAVVTPPPVSAPATQAIASTAAPAAAPAPAAPKKVLQAAGSMQPSTAPAPAPTPAPTQTQSAAATPAAPAPAPATPAPASAPSSAPAAATPAGDAKMAMLTPPAATPAPPAAPVEAGATVSIAFPKDGSALSDDGRGALTEVAKHAAADPSIQIQVLAYASGDEDNASKARRLSLSRALAVRSFLIDQGLHSTRIDVRALGNRVPEGPADRVDLVEVKH